MADRRLPIYILVDVSSSMGGEPIQTVKNNIRQLLADLKRDPKALDTAWISLITFGDTAQQVVPLSPLEEFTIPEFIIGGNAALGPALSLLCECRNREDEEKNAKQRGDWRPHVFCFTNARHLCGSFDQGVSDFKGKRWNKYVFIAASPDADVSTLKRINADATLNFEALRNITLSKYLAWVTYSNYCKITSSKMPPSIDDGEITDIPPLPPLPELDNGDESDEECGEVQHAPVNQRLPIYLVVDVSQSMDGVSIQEVNNCIQQLVVELRQDPKALDTAWISIITFGDGAEQLVPLTELEYFVIPELQIRNEKTNLGEALRLLGKCYDRDVRKPDASVNFRGDFAPLVFVFTDGKSDVGNLEQGIRDFKRKRWEKYAFCAAGSDADVSDLKRINPEAIIKLGNIQAGTFAKYFPWRHDEDSIKICSSLLRKNLVVYIVIDMSETMTGLPLEAIQFGLGQLANDLCKTNGDRCDLRLGVVGFNDDAVELLEPTAPRQVNFPPLEAKGRANIGKALTILSESAKRNDADLALPPLVFILSADGRTTGGFEEGLAMFRQQKWGCVIACAVGNGADISTLKRIEKKNALKLKDLRPSTILRFFDWISQSIKLRVEEVGRTSSQSEAS